MKPSFSYIYFLFRTNFLDQEWFTFDTAGTFIVGWEGGPTRNPELTQREQKEFRKGLKASIKDEFSRGHEGLDLADASDRPRTTATGIEIAAALATGVFIIYLFIKCRQTTLLGPSITIKQTTMKSKV